MQDGQIAISDLGLASLLATLDFQVIGMKRVDGKRINFLFAHTEEIDQVISDYWADIEISVPIQSLFNNQKLLKNRLYVFN